MPNPNYQQYLMPYMQYPYAMQNQPQNQPQQMNRNSTPLQNGGFILVNSEEEAYRYPVDYGKSMTFKVANEPIVIEKSMSFSQLDAPRIDRYRLVREDIVETPKPIESIEVEPIPDYDVRDELQAIRDELEGIKKKLYSNNNMKPANKKREDNDNE